LVAAFWAKATGAASISAAAMIMMRMVKSPDDLNA
jgi:hypothetical protein